MKPFIQPLFHPVYVRQYMDVFHGIQNKISSLRTSCPSRKSTSAQVYSLNWNLDTVFYWKKIDDVFTVEKNPLFSRKEWLYSKLWPWGRYIWGRKAVWMCPTKSWTPVSLPYPSMYHWLRPKIYSYREWSE